MRITGGEWRGRSLEGPKASGGTITRPTTDKVRQALFNSLSSLVGSLEGLRVLDCFAGTGALSFEALSRGADHAVMTEVDRHALRAIKSNIANLDCADCVTVRGGNTFELSAKNLHNHSFDVAFLDPPYSFQPADIAGLLVSLAQADALSLGAIIVYEYDQHSRFEPPEGFALIKEKEYGSTHVTYLRYEGVS